MKRDKILVAGAGGQGALRIGQMIAYAALNEGWEVEWLPSYGAEMRGGTANCSVTISNEEIPFPMVTEPDYCIVMNDLSLTRFQSQVRPGGYIILDSSIISDKVSRDDLKAYYVSADTIAEEEGNKKGANMVLLGAFIALSDKVSLKSVCNVIDQSFTGSKAKYAESNKRLVKRGFDLLKDQLSV
ncbi:MAG: 2-oxoacid:acceptor oxidoreductase family protein [Eubacteriales bacterium]|nr:2-oxoacid:acceptor oxidoreductase family protein [Eubacteriales bacterium]